MTDLKKPDAQTKSLIRRLRRLTAEYAAAHADMTWIGRLTEDEEINGVKENFAKAQKKIFRALDEVAFSLQAARYLLDLYGPADNPSSGETWKAGTRQNATPKET